MQGTPTPDNRSVIEHLYRAAAAGDLAAVESMLSDDCVLVEPASHPAAPNAGDGVASAIWNGRNDAMAGIAAVFGTIGTTGIDVHEIVTDGPHRVIGLIDALGMDHDGRPYALPVAELFLVADGKVTEIRPYYYDTVRLRALAGVD